MVMMRYRASPNQPSVILEYVAYPSQLSRPRARRAVRFREPRLCAQEPLCKFVSSPALMSCGCIADEAAHTCVPADSQASIIATKGSCTYDCTVSRLNRHDDLVLRRQVSTTAAQLLSSTCLRKKRGMSRAYTKPSRTFSQHRRVVVEGIISSHLSILSFHRHYRQYVSISQRSRP
jgi:hypothetical protein